jgi:bifunctional non-homologous end joining protein LigD
VVYRTMSLREYQAKRDFERTREPSGRPRAAERNRQHPFVVQKHDASHLHYDFRLEMQGVLKSWAVPKGFPFKRGDRRLAVEVEDHPVDYGGFEGTIPEGNYGAGTVMLWDRGTYEVSGDDPIGSLESGKIHFTLKGKKLKGEWTLVRMRHFQGAKPQWLLLKSGADLPAISARLDDQSVLTRRSMDEIAGAKRGRQWQSNRSSSRRTAPEVKTARVPRLAASGRNGLVKSSATRSRSSSKKTASTNAPAFAGKLKGLPSRKAEFLEPMKAQLVTRLPKGAEWLYEIKFDGVRALAIKNKKALDLLSRSGKDLKGRYGQILDELLDLAADQVILDGEVVAVDSKGRSSFQLLQSYQSAIGTKPPLLYYVFDVLQLNGKDLTVLPLSQRKQIAEELVRGLSAIRFSGNIKANSNRVMLAMQKKGLEGLIAKKKDSRYEPGRRSGAWAKFKWTNEQEFVIGGFTHPKGSRSHFGAILVGVYEAGRLRFSAKVGTGFNDQALEFLHTKFQKLIQPGCPFFNLPERGGGLTAGVGPAEMKRCTWLRPELVCEVRFAEWTRDQHLRQPAFLGLREDKPPREVHREIPM